MAGNLQSCEGVFESSEVRKVVDDTSRGLVWNMARVFISEQVRSDLADWAKSDSYQNYNAFWLFT